MKIKNKIIKLNHKWAYDLQKQWEKLKKRKVKDFYVDLLNLKNKLKRKKLKVFWKREKKRMISKKK